MNQAPVEALREELKSVLASWEYETAVRMAVGAVRDGGVEIPALYMSVLSPLLAEIGYSWAHGSERVWQEHLASHAIRTIIESLYLDVRGQAARVTRRNQTVLLACPPQEQHELGLRMLADRFDLAGYDVVLLGADTPVEEIVAAATATRASIVALSISTTYERVAFRTFVHEIRAGLAGIRVVVGGPAFERGEHWPSEDLLDTTDLELPGVSEVG